MQYTLSTWHDEHSEYSVDDVTKLVTKLNNEGKGIDELRELKKAMEAEKNGGPKVVIDTKNNTYYTVEN